MRAVATIALLTLAACGGPEQVRLATKEEAANIISAVVARIMTTDRNVCFNRKITPALEDQRDIWRFHQVPKEVSEGDAKSWFVPAYPPEPQPVPASLGRELEQKLRQAAKTAVHKESRLRGEEVVPRALLGPERRSDLPCGRPKMTEYTLSEPVLVGSTAFIEKGRVCGGLCGGGSIEVYDKDGSDWRLVAWRPTWMS